MERQSVRECPAQRQRANDRVRYGIDRVHVSIGARYVKPAAIGIDGHDGCVAGKRDRVCLRVTGYGDHPNRAGLVAGRLVGHPRRVPRGVERDPGGHGAHRHACHETKGRQVHALQARRIRARDVDHVPRRDVQTKRSTAQRGRRHDRAGGVSGHDREDTACWAVAHWTHRSAWGILGASRTPQQQCERDVPHAIHNDLPLVVSS